MYVCKFWKKHFSQEGKLTESIFQVDIDGNACYVSFPPDSELWRTHNGHKDIKRGSMPYGGQFEFTSELRSLSRHLFVLLPHSLRNAYDETRENKKKRRRANGIERPLLGNHVLASVGRILESFSAKVSWEPYCTGFDGNLLFC